MAQPAFPLCNPDDASEVAARIALAKCTLIRALARQAARECWQSYRGDQGTRTDIPEETTDGDGR